MIVHLSSSHVVFSGRGSMTSTRDRFDGDVADFSRILALAVDGVKWLQYSEGIGQPLVKSEVQKHMGLIVSLKGLQKNLSFSKQQCIDAFTQVLADKPFFQRMTETERVDWCETMDKRLRRMLRDVAQLDLKGSKWFRAAENDATPLLEASLGRSLGDGLEKYQFGFDYEHWAAWRSLKGKKEYTEDLKYEDLAADIDAVTAVWPDGMKWEVAGLLVVDLVAHRAGAKPQGRRDDEGKAEKTRMIMTGMRFLAKTKKKLKHSNLFWEGFFQGKRLEVKRRPDRELLVALLYNKKMICMAKAGLFANLQTGLEFMKQIALEITDGSLEISAVYARRDELLAKLAFGDEKTRTEVMKRPAMAATTGDMHKKEQSSKKDSDVVDVSSEVKNMECMDGEADKSDCPKSSSAMGTKESEKTNKNKKNKMKVIEKNKKKKKKPKRARGEASTKPRRRLKKKTTMRAEEVLDRRAEDVYPPIDPADVLEDWFDGVSSTEAPARPRLGRTQPLSPSRSRSLEFDGCRWWKPSENDNLSHSIFDFDSDASSISTPEEIE